MFHLVSYKCCRLNQYIPESGGFYKNEEVEMINEDDDIKVEPEFYLTKDGIVKSITV